MKEKEFYEMSDKYIAKLWDIAKKEWLKIFSSVMIYDSKNNIWYKSLDWRNMNESELLKANSIINREIVNNFMEDITNNF